MKYLPATSEFAQAVYQLVQETILQTYPIYYPQEVVDFFCQLHSQENITKDIEHGIVGMLMDGEELIGTGSCTGNYVTRVYIKPVFQRQGHGSYIMDVLENQIALEYDVIYLDSSLPAKSMYEKRGYTTVREETWEVANHTKFAYDVMEKATETSGYIPETRRHLGSGHKLLTSRGKLH